MKDYKVDRSRWRRNGPWDNEKDRYEWRHLGFPCLIIRNQSGGLCGYVGITEDHPEYNRDIDDIPVDVHGGVTYFSPCDGEYICHVPQQGEKEVKWVGFDCIHAGDDYPTNCVSLVKSYKDSPFWSDSFAYRDLQYVKKEVNSLAEQLDKLNV